MKRAIVFGSILSAAVLFSPAAGAKKPFEICGRLKVVGTNLCNKNGYQIQLRGMSTHGLQWFENCITDKSLDVLANQWGADILRLSMYVHEDGYLTNPPYFRALIDKIVDKLLQRGIYCLIDWHQLDPGDPNADIDSARTFFQYMSAKHGSKGHVLYDICNEPNGTAVTWPVITKYANEIIPIIRKNDPQSVIIVGTPYWASRPDQVIGALLPYDNIMYTMHFYAADHKEEYRNYTVKAIEGGVPVFVTEFGTQERTGDGPNDFTSSQLWLDLLAKYKISWTNWNYSDDFRSGAVWKTGTSNSGQWTDANLKEAGTWIKQHISNPPDDFISTAVSKMSKQTSTNFKILITGKFKTNAVSFSLPQTMQYSDENTLLQLLFYGVSGKKINAQTVQLRSSGVVDAATEVTQNLSSGMYVVVLCNQGRLIGQKIVKF